MVDPLAGAPCATQEDLAAAIGLTIPPGQPKKGGSILNRRPGVNCGLDSQSRYRPGREVKLDVIIEDEWWSGGSGVPTIPEKRRILKPCGAGPTGREPGRCPHGVMQAVHGS